MNCEQCKDYVEQIVYCDCFAQLCRECFEGHHCGRESLARFSRGGDPPTGMIVGVEEIQQYDPRDLSNAMVKLRPYQQEAINAILEVLT